MAIRTVFSNRDGREKKVLANKDYYKTLVDSKKEATFLADAEGDIYLLNKKAQLLTGYSEEEIREYHVRDILVTLKNIDNPFDSRQFSEFTARLYLLDSRRYLVPVMFDFKEIEGQKFLGTCIVITDNEPPAATAESATYLPEEPVTILQPLISNEIQGRLSTDFEHQVRTLLNNMLGFGSILSRESLISNDKKLADTLESILKSGNQLKKLFNKISIGDSDTYDVMKTPCLLAPILQKAQILLDPVSRQNNMVIKVRQSVDITVFSDEFLLLGLLKFLLEKAILFTRNEEVFLDIKEGPSQGKVSIYIDNLGHDIPQGIINFIRRENSKDQYDLNNPVITQSEEIRSILHTLNRIDGKITFTEGTTMGEIVQITLPVATKDEPIDDLVALENSIREKSLKILIVEDEKFTARIFHMYLGDICGVSLAYSGNEALNITETFYNKGIVFNAVIMDIGLPKPWDGILLKKEMEKRWPEYQNIPFLAQTAFTAKSYADRIAGNKFQELLVKPVNRSDLLRFINRFCK